MLRTVTCGALRSGDCGKEVVLCGWVQGTRVLGGLTFVDIRDRYGMTQLVFNMDQYPGLCNKARKLGREYVIQATGIVRERESKNPKMSTGAIEVLGSKLDVLNESKTPPFTIEKESDGGEDLRMQYRYLDLRRQPVRDKLMLRHRCAMAVREYLDGEDFVEIETPFLIKSTPEGARDFVVPSRMHPGSFYALPQSPQTFKQLLMVSGFDRYFQIVRCFRDEDLRADRQPEFTQIDCEMSFVEQDDILMVFEGLIKHVFKACIDVALPDFEIMNYDAAMSRYGSDKPDLRFGLEIHELGAAAKGHSFPPFETAEYIGGINVPGGADMSRKQIDALVDFVRTPQVGATGLVYVKCLPEGGYKSSVAKFYPDEATEKWAHAFNAKPGDMLLIMAGDRGATLNQLGVLRLEVAERRSLVPADRFCPLWVVDFPLLEWDEETQRFHAMHHPFTSPKDEDITKLDTAPESVRANAYDMVINGVELGGGSIRIHDKKHQQKMFSLLGFTPEEAQRQFGFLMNAFEYGAPPHGGIAFGFDRLNAMLGGSESIRDYIAFPKNNAGRDVMIDSPDTISAEQLNELHLSVNDNQ